MIRVEEALNQILSAFSPLGPEKINILESLGRVIAEDIFAVRDIPPHDNSAMDGYAVFFEDTKGASREKPVSLDVVEDIPAGSVPKKKLTRGKASRIMTGAPLPEGANAIVKVEDTDKKSHSVIIYAEVLKGQDIRRAGEDVPKGELIIPRGNVIKPAEIGMMAALGRSFISIHQKPLVAVLATGDELVDVDALSSPWQIISSNSYSLTAQILECGAEPMMLGIAKDTREDLLAKFKAAMRADIIISSGGVSMGDYDLVKDIMKEVGNRMKFWQVAMRPGKPLAFGTLEGIPIFGLPGNPVSSMVSFEQFVRPSILKMSGHTKLFRNSVKATLEDNIKKSKGARHFIRSFLSTKNDRYFVRTTGDQGSGILKSMVEANSLIVLPENTSVVKAGSKVCVQLLDNSLMQSATPTYL